jgi:hypothetical protein
MEEEKLRTNLASLKDEQIKAEEDLQVFFEAKKMIHIITLQIIENYCHFLLTDAHRGQ